MPRPRRFLERPSPVRLVATGGYGPTPVGKAPIETYPCPAVLAGLDAVAGCRPANAISDR